MKYNICIVLLFGVLFQMTGCVKEIELNETVEVINIPSQEIISTSFYGQITNELGDPILNAKVFLMNARNGSVERSTDESGNFQFLDQEVKGHYANLKVIAEGMWEVNKTVFLLKDNTSRIDIVCQSHETEKVFSSNENSKIRLDHDINIEFLAGSISYLNGEDYSGDVKILARSIVKGQDQFDKMNPGSSWGLNKNNEISRIFPIVTIDVILKDFNGNDLQLKEDHEAIVKMKLPEGTNVDALETSVMHFNKALFSWDENTEYTISNDYIEVEISHFSTWSWCQIVALKATLKGIVDPTNSGNTFEALHYVTVHYEPISFQVPTGLDGSFNMPFALGSLPFTLDVQNECEDLVFSKEYQAIAVDEIFDVGVLSVDSEALSYSQLTVDVINCDSTWVENGYATISFDGLDFKRKEVIPISNGSFDYSFLDCDSELIGKLFILDEGNLMTTDPIEINLNNGDIHLGEVILCDTFDSYMEILVDGNQILRDHDLQWGCTSNGDGEQITGINGSAIFQTSGYWDGPGDYPVNIGSFVDLENDLLYKVDNQVVFTLQDFEPNQSDPDNECYRPSILIGSFSGIAKEYDNATGVYLKDVNVSGNFEYL